ncbi:MAG TPA: hypothetical protein VND93_06015, partial [Myxococcales bacterium]|nr:hypothetical protein [Myxococcales bacterium]
MSAISVETRWERLLEEQDGEARAALARRLRREPPPSEGMMTRALRSTDAGLRKLVAWIAGGLPWAAASTPIRHALQDARPTVRRAAVMALAAHPGDEPAGLLGGATA